ncbi:isochorismatase family protein [Kocuria sp.]|uniref:isochorismatase family protein n=1 Tax=Kocuria sp. TaxID=1871328 RepID=UPI0026DFB3A2|nr:isochorismatase family protein [Kocuria sp.]MDO5618422.1 isochorismatase family protein [Kocuria sp.]
MPIPKIDSYLIPSPSEADRVDWVVDSARSAVLVHDMQKYFLRAYDLDQDPVATAVTNMQRIVAAARAAEVPVVYSVQPGDQHPARRGLLRDFWGDGMAAGVDTEVIDALRPTAQDIVVTKWRYSAFQRTDLRDLLARAGRDQLIIVGVYAHMGCQMTAAEAFMQDIQSFLVHDAVADFSAAEHLSAVDYVAKRCGRSVSSENVLESMRYAARLGATLG